LSAFARLERPDIARLPRAATQPPPREWRRIFIGGAGGWLDAQIFNRDALEPGFSASGPAVIEEYGSTTLVWPGDRFEIGALHEIRIKCAGR
jgi:N-methylhydantoinase A